MNSFDSGGTARNRAHSSLHWLLGVALGAGWVACSSSNDARAPGFSGGGTPQTGGAAGSVGNGGSGNASGTTTIISGGTGGSQTTDGSSSGGADAWVPPPLQD